jgi:hypothetical protein
MRGKFALLNVVILAAILVSCATYPHPLHRSYGGPQVAEPVQRKRRQPQRLSAQPKSPQQPRRRSQRTASRGGPEPKVSDH